MTMTRTQAEAQLKANFGIDHFYDEQWRAIDMLLQGRRVLMVEKTGFGKSLCYQFPATQLTGTAVVFSPLVALMNDQVESLRRRGISAACLNYMQAPEEQDEVLRQAKRGQLKVLYISPERQENSKWSEAVAPGSGMRISMIVIDEAHTISQWGHDFRPAFRKIGELVRRMPNSIPVLAVTATATERVQADIARQISTSGGSDITSIRGELCRDNFRLHVVRVKSDEEKMAWLAQYLPNMEGSGLIYAGTRTEAEVNAAWLKKCGIKAECYHAGLDAQTRNYIQEGLMTNRYKCVVSTNALGMGIDKPDIRFVIHTQMPQSPINYYQEIGRAGRDGKEAQIVLLFNETTVENERHGQMFADEVLPNAFIDGGRPSVKVYENVIALVRRQRLTERGIQKELNMKQTPLRTVLADLEEQGVVRKVQDGKSKVVEFAGGTLDTKAFEELRDLRRQELKKMTDYVFTTGPRMQYLCQFLEDKHTVPASGCDNTTEPPMPLTDDKTADARHFMEFYHPTLVVETKTSNIRNGAAASYYGASNVGKLIHKSKYEDGGDFDSKLADLTEDAFRSCLGTMRYDKIIYVPPTSHGDLVRNFAVEMGRRLGISVCHGLTKVRETKEQKIFQNGWLKQDNVKDVFDISPSLVSGRNILLIDDVFDSGATIKEIGRMLTKRGAANIVPLVIARTVGGD